MSNIGYFDGILQQLLAARKSHYSQDSINFYLEEDRYIIEDLRQVVNQWQERLKCTLIRHRGKQKERPSRCIVYLHGMGSTRLQSLSLVQHLPNNCSLCMFDMSGSGKSQGELTTYGIKECEDIEPVIAHLHSKMGIKQFVLWGRSMGAVAALLHAIKNNSAPKSQLNKDDYLRDAGNSSLIQNHKKFVKAIVLDSPFHNFRDIAKDTAIQKFSLPSFLADAAVAYMQSSFSRILANRIGEQYNPFHINFDQQINLSIPIIMLYSQKDQIVPFTHSERIIKNIKSKFQKILINQCSHNEVRPTNIIGSIFQKLEKYCKVRQYESRRFSSQRSVVSYSSQKKRGIFVFTPSKDKEIKCSVDNLQSGRRLNQSPRFIYPVLEPPLTSIRQSPKSTALTPRRTKLTLQSSQMFTKNIKDDQKQSRIATMDTQTNNLISKKMIGITDSEGRGTRILRSKRLNMEKRREVKIGRQKYLQ